MSRHGVVGSATALETYPWTAYPELLGLRTPEVSHVPTTLALLHDDTATARSVLRAAMAERVARWHAQRDGNDPCEEPGCRGEADGCRLVHPERVRCVRRRDAPAPHGAGPTPPLVGIAGQHDALADRRARLLAIGWDATSLVVPVCARLGADPAALLRGGRRLAECRARAVIVYVVCDGAALSVTAAARLLGVSDTAVGAARRRGRDLLAELGWTIEDVLSWSGFQA